MLLLIPAITDQWTDKSKQVDVKRGLLSRMTAGASTAIGTSRVVGLNLLPESQLADRRRDLGTATPASELSEAKAEATVGNGAILAWEKASATIGAELGAYFPDSSLPADWRGYARAVRNYQNIQSSICGGERVELVAAVRRYLDKTKFSPAELNRLRAFANRVARATPSTEPPTAAYRAMYTKAEFDALNALGRARFGMKLDVNAAARRAKWKALIVEEGADCQGKPRAFRISYGYLGDQLLEHEDTVLQRVAKGDLAGFSSGPGGLLRRLTFSD